MTRFTTFLVLLVLIFTLSTGCEESTPTSPPEPTTSTVIVNRAPDALSCTWQLEGPDSYFYDGSDDETLTSLDPGEYTLTWGAVAGWDRPDPLEETETVAAGATITFSGTYTEVVSEAVSPPDAPIGPAAGIEDQDLSYTATNAVDNLGHDVEYRFAWGDDSFSIWGITAVQNSWATAGTYQVKAQARCIDHPAIISTWSDSIAVTISVFVAETVSTPAAPTGAATIQVGQSSPYSTSGAVSNYGDDLEYRFDWGGSQYSSWNTLTSRSHSWAAEGTYEVKVQARCDDHPTVESEWSTATTITITAAPVETISTPDAPAGPTTGETDETLAYTASGAVSSFGHLVEYRFDFDDGPISGWLSALTGLSHDWSTAGSYEVKVQARCRTHTAIESAWSAATTVVISDPDETIASLPTTINGIAAGIINDPYEYLVIHSSRTNLGDAIEGRFDWGDGTFSDWIAAPPYQATHTWTTEGTYIVRYEARCSVHPSLTVSPDSLVVTITTTAVETIEIAAYYNIHYSLRTPEINIPISYYVYGGASSLGHDVEVRVDWGDGTESAWVPYGTLVMKTWTEVGTFNLRRQARCIAHPDVITEWSDPPTTINTKAPETVSTPDTPTGPTLGHRNESLFYTASGAESSWHTGSLEYRYDWGDGIISDWTTITNGGHKFTNYGDYEIRIQARCVYTGHGEPESEWSPAIVVSIVENVTINRYAPRGPYFAAVGESNTWEIYSTASSDAGHSTFEYQFDWGDGSFSVWSSSETADHAFTTAGSYDIVYRARCAVDTLAASEWSEQDRTVEVTADPEVIETPDYPAAYPSSGIMVNEEIQISATDSYSNHGHPIEYQFDYGDGTISDWTLGTPWSGYYQLGLRHTYTSTGSFDITVKARCATHTAIESAVSPVRTITVNEVIERPAAPTGPSTGVIGANLTFTTAGTTGSEGHTLEYQFEYRRSTYSVYHTSDWSTSLTDDHVFTEVGTTYNVRVRARCATHTGSYSYDSVSFPFTITD